MLIRLLLAFTLIPLLELILLIQLGKNLGLWPTIAIVIFTGFFGILLARSQGLGVLYRIRSDLETGKLPTEELLTGLCILVGGAMLLTPGLITDTFGFMLLIPLTRGFIKQWIRNLLNKMLQKGTLRFYFRIK